MAGQFWQMESALNRYTGPVWIAIRFIKSTLTTVFTIILITFTVLKGLPKIGSDEI